MKRDLYSHNPTSKLNFYLVSSSVMESPLALRVLRNFSRGRFYWNLMLSYQLQVNWTRGMALLRFWTSMLDFEAPLFELSLYHHHHKFKQLCLWHITVLPNMLIVSSASLLCCVDCLNFLLNKESFNSGKNSWPGTWVQDDISRACKK